MIDGAVTVTGGTVYCTAVHDGAPYDDDARHAVHAADIATRRPRWTSGLPEAAVSSPVVVAGCLLVATLSGHVHAFDAATGRLVWTVESGHEIVNWYHLVEDFGAYYEEEGQALLLGDHMMYVRTRAGIVALAE